VRKINGCQGVFGKEKTFGNKLILTIGKEKESNLALFLYLWYIIFTPQLKLKEREKSGKKKRNLT